MGVDFYYCRVCKETYPDCGYIQVKSCESCEEGLCSDCLEKHNPTDKIKYWINSEPAFENSEERILKEFCPLCNSEKKNETQN